MLRDADGNVKEGGFTIYQPSGEEMPIYDASMRYQNDGTPLVVIAGVEYGNGSSRDWAAKGTKLLGVRAVIAESYERIHRSNLVGMGIVPFVFADGLSADDLGLTGAETITIKGLTEIHPRQEMVAQVTFPDGQSGEVPVVCRIDTLDELEYLKNGGILNYVLRNLATAA
jgi:aconitate hydratase